MLKMILVNTEGPFPGERRFTSKHNTSMRAGHKLMGEFWIHGGPRERHFLLSARARYGYTPRSANYQKAKSKKWGHTLYLVWSGRSRADTELSRVTPSSRRARMSIPAGTLNYSVGAINMREELLRLHLDDEREMQMAFGSAYQTELVRQRGGSIQLLQVA